jgi:hypothetical protein
MFTSAFISVYYLRAKVGLFFSCVMVVLLPIRKPLRAIRVDEKSPEKAHSALVYR